MRILLADDDAACRDVARIMLEAEGHVVRPVETGRDVLCHCPGDRPCDFDLLVLDVVMPEVDGLSVVAELRGRPSTRTVPIILLSASPYEACRKAGVLVGADYYMVKPYTRKDLLAVIAKVTPGEPRQAPV